MIAYNWRLFALVIIRHVINSLGNIQGHSSFYKPLASMYELLWMYAKKSLVQIKRPLLIDAYRGRKNSLYVVW